MAKLKLLKVVNASRSEGPLYAARGEDEELHCFDSTVTVLASDGKVYRHKTFVVRGAIEMIDGEGFKMGFCYPNRNYKAQVQAFIDKVEARGVIDLRYWVEVPAGPTQDEREAYNLKVEQDERTWGGWNN